MPIHGSKIHLITKSFAHHSRYSGYDRLLDFVPNAPLRTLPIGKLVSKKQKLRMIAECPARWDHYGLPEIEREFDILYSPYLLGKRILHFLYGENTFCHAANQNRSNKVFVATYHQPPSWFSSSGKERYDYFTSRVGRLDGVIAVSSDQADFFRNFNERVCFVPHGIDVDFFTPAEQMPDRKLCLFVGNWLRDFETLNRCSHIIRSRAPHLELHVVTPEKNKPLLQGAAVKVFCGISDEELRDQYRKASVVLLPLSDCTANNSALEAMSCGVPIVVSDVGGIRDYISSDTGIFCRRGNADEMVDAVVTLLEDEGRRAVMGSNARNRAVQHFAWPVVAKQMTEAYSSFL